MLMAEMADTADVAMEKVLRNVGRDWCRAAMKLTPGTKAGKSPRWVRPKGTKGVYVPWKRKGEPKGIARQKKGGGFAKSGWSGCLTRLGVKPRIVKAPALTWANAYIKQGERVVDKSHESKYSKQWSEVKAFYVKGKISLKIANTCPFIDDFDKGKNPKRVPLHIGQKAMQATLRNTAKYLWRAAQKVKQQSLGI